MVKKIVPVLFCLSLALVPSYQAAQHKQLDVPFVPTKYPVVDEMLKMANVQKTDIVYDLGCGDGRLVIGAAQKYGARGVGIDIDPERIKESKDNAAKAGVSNLVQFLEQDLFQTDFHEATVMTLYLLSSVNRRLRPKLLQELKPGTRVVSHDFDMDEWKPDQSSEVLADDISHDVFLWIIPANVSGTWTWTMGKPAVKCEMNLEQLFQVPSGSATIGGAAAEIKGLTLKGDQIWFTVERPFEGKLVPMAFEGKVAGHNITGKIKFQAGGKESVWDWKAGRNPATEKPIDNERGNNSFRVN
jgi:ubiquinone/menaquinone biosynthesis C-methylase UbiE